METEASTAVDVTNKRLLITKEGAAIQSNDDVPPPDDEVTHH